MKVLKTIRGHAALMLICLASGQGGFRGYGQAEGSSRGRFWLSRIGFGNFRDQSFQQVTKVSKRTKSKKLGAI
jgi:hypothetical protein